MKKIIALALAAAFTLVVLTACGGDNSSQPEAPAYDVADILRAVEQANPLEEPKDIDQAYMEWLGIDGEMYENFAGHYVSPGVDIMLVVQAKEGSAADVRARLESHAESVSAEQENYDKALSEKAAGARVYTKGDYVVFVIAGDTAVVETDGVDKAYEAIDKAIDEAFK